jgi:hypothetical protein
MIDAVQRFRTALEARNLDAVCALLAEEVVFRSPVVSRPYHGRRAVTGILDAVFRVLDDWRCVRDVGGPEDRDHALVFQARIGERQIEGCDFVHLDESDSIDEFYVMVRPLSGAVALADAMRAQLAPAER